MNGEKWRYFYRTIIRSYCQVQVFNIASGWVGLLSFLRLLVTSFLQITLVLPAFVPFFCLYLILASWNMIDLCCFQNIILSVKNSLFKLHSRLKWWMLLLTFNAFSLCRNTVVERIKGDTSYMILLILS